MSREEKKIKIFNLITEKKEISVEELSNRFTTSPSTIRRLLQEMEDSNLIRRTHGGAKSIKAKDESIDYHNKMNKNYFEKLKIARKAASLIEDNDFVLIGSSTITHLMAQYITAENITIVTNSLNVANEVKTKHNCQLILLGGYYLKPAETIEGLICANQIKEMYFNKAFLGTDGVDYDFGISTITEIEKSSKFEAIKNSDQCYFLCQNTKFDTKTIHKIADFSSITAIITDPKLKSELYDKYSQKCTIIIAED